MGILLSVSDLNDIERITYIKAGRKFLAQMDRRQKIKSLNLFLIQVLISNYYLLSI